MTLTNATTNAIINTIHFIGGCAFRNNTGGVYDPKIKRFRRSVNRSAIGSGDVIACVGGRYLEIEVKTGKDRMSQAQLLRKDRVEKSGGMYWVVKTTDDFLRLMDEHNLRRK